MQLMITMFYFKCSIQIARGMYDFDEVNNDNDPIDDDFIVQILQNKSVFIFAFFSSLTQKEMFIVEILCGNRGEKI